MNKNYKILITIVLIVITIFFVLSLNKTGKVSDENIIKNIEEKKEKYHEFVTPFSADIEDVIAIVEQDKQIELFINSEGVYKFWFFDNKEYKQNKKRLKSNYEIEDKCRSEKNKDIKEKCQKQLSWYNSFFDKMVVSGKYKMRSVYKYLDENDNWYNFLEEKSTGITYLFINDKKIKIGKVSDNSLNNIRSVYLVNGKISFAYNKDNLSEEEKEEIYACHRKKIKEKKDNFKDCGEIKTHWDFFYEEPNLAKKLGVQSIENIFEYKGKIGFIGGDGDKVAIYFDGKKLSKDFDQIKLNACCAMMPFPFKIYDNGVLFFMGKRDDKYILAEVRLEE